VFITDWWKRTGIGWPCGLSKSTVRSRGRQKLCLFVRIGWK